MKIRSLVVSSLSVLASVLLVAQASAEDVADTSSRTPLDAITWTDIGGPLAAAVSGDFMKGKHIMLIKFSAGMTTPLHTHSSDYTGVVVAGLSRHFVPGKPETEVDLVPGSFWSIPANLPHVSQCLPGADCIFALFQEDGFDFVVTK